MKNLNLIWFILFLICSVDSFFAQNSNLGKPDFNGIWVLQYEESRFDKFTCAIHKKLENFTRVLVIEQKGNTIKTVEKNNWNWLDKNSNLPTSAEAKNIYFTNNRGETNVIGEQTYRTKTKWSSNRLIITHLTDGTFVKVEPYATSEIVLSEDNNRLTWHYKIITDSKQEEEEFKDLQTYLVFRRKKE